MVDGGFSLKRKACTEMEMRLLKLKKEAWFSEFIIPGNNKGGYFTSNANFAAFEHRAIMQVYCMILVMLTNLYSLFELVS
jgi:hypothetical protein